MIGQVNEILHRKQLLVIVKSFPPLFRFTNPNEAKDVDGLNNKGKKVLEGEVSENAKVDGEGDGRKDIRFIMKGKGKQVMNDPNMIKGFQHCPFNMVQIWNMLGPTLQCIQLRRKRRRMSYLRQKLILNTKLQKKRLSSSILS